MKPEPGTSPQISIKTHPINHHAQSTSERNRPTRPSPSPKDNDVQIRGLQIHGSARHLAARHHQRPRSVTNAAFPKVFRSTALRSAAGRRSTPPTCSPCPTISTAMIDPFNEMPTLSLICSIFDPITKEKYERDPRSDLRERDRVSQLDRASATRRTSRRKRSSSSSTTCATT